MRGDTMEWLLDKLEQYDADMEAIRHELETIWEAINELQGIDPERAGEPNAK